MSVAISTPQGSLRTVLTTLGGALCLGGGWPVTKDAVLHGAAPLVFAEGRLGFSLLVCAAMLLIRRDIAWPRRADWPAVAGIGVFQFGGFFALSHLGLGLVSAGRTAILANATTIFIVPLTFLVLRESVPALRWVGAGLGVAGVAALMLPAADSGSALGYLLLLGAAFSWSLAMIMQRKYPPTLSMLQILPWSFGIGFVLLLPLAWHDAGPHPMPRAAWPDLLLVGAVAAPLGTWCVLDMARRLPPILASVLYLLSPLTGLLLSVAWLGETLDASLVIGAALILAGVAVAAIQGRPRRIPL